MRLTRSGVSLLAIGAATLVVARTVQVRQMWMIAASLLVAVVAAMITVARRNDSLVLTRTVEPDDLRVGIDARVVVDLEVTSSRPSPPVVLTSGTTSWRLPPLPPGTTHRFSWTLSTARRGMVSLPPMEVHRADPLGLVRRSRVASSAVDVVVAPRTAPLVMAQMGVGALGSQLTQRARHFGVGEFEGLRHYVEGDDLRLVHWKASARSTELLVKQYSLEGVRRCTVVIDTSTASTEDEFETAVSIAASLVEAACDTDLSMRLATTGGMDLPPTASLVGRRQALAALVPSSAVLLPQRDPADGVGVLICITPTIDSEPWLRRDQFADPAMVTLAASLRGEPGTNVIDGSSLEGFAQAWNRLATARTNLGGLS